jgi:hypothetical protein
MLPPVVLPPVVARAALPKQEQATLEPMRLARVRLEPPKRAAVPQSQTSA